MCQGRANSHSVGTPFRDKSGMYDYVPIFLRLASVLIRMTRRIYARSALCIVVGNVIYQCITWNHAIYNNGINSKGLYDLGLRGNSLYNA